MGGRLRHDAAGVFPSIVNGLTFPVVPWTTLAMADVTITAANVALQSGYSVEGTAGATITAGAVLYLDASTKKLKLADCVTSSATATIVGIALNGASDTQPIAYVPTGASLTTGGTLVVGTIYVLSESGLFAPSTDLATNDYVSVLGVATTTGILKLGFINSGVQVP